MSRAAVLPLLAAILSGQVQADDRELATYPLRHRLPEEIIPLIRPLLEPGDAAIPSRAGLIVKATPAKLAEINALIGELDRAQHRLQIIVAQGAGLTLDRLDARLNLQIQAQPGNVSVGGRGHYYQTEVQDASETTQRLQTLEGQAAFIRTGDQIPLPSQSLAPGYGGAFGYIPGIEYREVSTGFAVTPHLTGDGQVRLDIAPWSDRLTGRGGVIATQEAQTTMQAPLGSWVELGGVLNSRDWSQQELLGQSYGTRSDQHKIFLLVIDLDAERP